MAIKLYSPLIRPVIGRSVLALVLIFPSVIMVTGCSPIKNLFGADNEETDEFFIPEQETAEKQFAYAEYIRDRTPPSADEKRRQQQMEQIIQAYQKVIDLFPQDREVTPLSKCMIGMLYLRTPDRKADGARLLHEVDQLYPDNNTTQIRALLHLGYYYDDLGQFETAQELYREVFERWGNSTDPNELQMANKARNRYNRVRPRTQ